MLQRFGFRAPAPGASRAARARSGDTRRGFPAACMALALVALAHGCTVWNVVEVTVESVKVEPDSVTILEGETHQLTAEARDELGRLLPDGAVTWSSDAPAVFSIDSVTGEGMAHSPGQATIWASVLGTRGSATVSVEPGPRFAVSPLSLHLTGSVGETGLSGAALDITNGGGGSLVGISAAAQYPAGAPAGWLSLALAGTSAPTTLTVSSQLGLLAEGVYDATLVLTAADARVAPVSVPVQAAVTLDTPVIGLTPTALAFQMLLGGPTPALQTVRITNEGGGVLSDLQAVRLYLDGAGWLSTTLTATTAPADLQVQPLPSGLGMGTYRAEVRITAPGALNSPRSVDVTLSIAAGPVHAPSSTATVPGGTAGQVTGIVVLARDAFGNPLSVGGATVVVRVTGANSAGPITATDLGDGTYTAGYTPTQVGTDNVAITLNGTAIGGSPFGSAVAPGAASPAHSTAIVPSGRTWRTTNIVVQAKDAYGNALTVGGDKVVVTVSGTNPTEPINATDMGNGTYTASYIPTRRGTDFVAITLNGAPISGSPFTSEVRR